MTHDDEEEYVPASSGSAAKRVHCPNSPYCSYPPNHLFVASNLPKHRISCDAGVAKRKQEAQEAAEEAEQIVDEDDAEEEELAKTAQKQKQPSSAALAAIMKRLEKFEQQQERVQHLRAGAAPSAVVPTSTAQPLSETDQLRQELQQLKQQLSSAQSLASPAQVTQSVSPPTSTVQSLIPAPATVQSVIAPPAATTSPTLQELQNMVAQQQRQINALKSGVAGDDDDYDDDDDDDSSPLFSPQKKSKYSPKHPRPGRTGQQSLWTFYRMMMASSKIPEKKLMIAYKSMDLDTKEVLKKLVEQYNLTVPVRLLHHI